MSAQSAEIQLLSTFRAQGSGSRLIASTARCLSFIIVYVASFNHPRRSVTLGALLLADVILVWSAGSSASAREDHWATRTRRNSAEEPKRSEHQPLTAYNCNTSSVLYPVHTPPTRQRRLLMATVLIWRGSGPLHRAMRRCVRLMTARLAEQHNELRRQSTAFLEEGKVPEAKESALDA